MEINKSLVAHNLGKRLIIDGKPFVGGICLHDTAGSGTHNDTRYLANPGDGRVVSVDFTVERDGSVYQLNPDLDKNCTFHAGRATKWIAAGRVFKNRAVTQVLIGIELCHKADAKKDVPVWPADQVKAVALLCRDLCSTYGLTREQITTHARIITDGSRSDPRAFPFETFDFYFNGEVNGDPANSIFYEVAAGDTLSRIANKFGTSIESIKALNGIATASNLIKIGEKLIIKP